MLGDSVNFFSQADLNRFYVSSMAGYFPLERNAFDVQRKRCQTRTLRSVQAANTILIVCVSDYDATDYGYRTESNVVDLFARKQRQVKADEALPSPRILKWNALYRRESA